MSQHNHLARLRARLEKLELHHLRQLALEQHNRIEQLQADLQRATDTAHNAEIIAEMWRDAAEALQASAGESATVAMTPEGQIGVIK